MKGSIFERNVPGTTEILQKATVGIAGLGGLGSNAAISLARAGIGKLILADADVVEPSNLNRQHYFLSDVGKKKVEAIASHLRNINPDIELALHGLELTPENVREIFGEADLLVEAFDRAESKRWLIESWCRVFPEKPIVCASGLSGIGDTNSLRVHSAGRIHLCGDEESDMSAGLCAARVALVANMQANVAVELLTRAGGTKPPK
jgi:sulfur carrier protein ThiS adenylyltransferase